MSRMLTEHVLSSFREDAPRPPVPGEEGTGPCYNPGKPAMTRPAIAAKPLSLVPSGNAARRNEDGLGEPEGSASPDSPLARWNKSLHSLLGDLDGADLFRTFLEREKCVDILDFWFACNGFRQMDVKDSKTLRVAKAIYKRYIENNCIVAEQLKPATKTFIRDNVKRQLIDSAMFDQAQTEIQTTMEENAYQMFLNSDIYLDYVRSGCENASHVSPNGLGGLKLVCGYLPTLNEEEEWSCNDFKAKALASVVGLSAKALRATVSMRTAEMVEKGYRSYRRGDPMSSYHAGSFATSANDSEVSSDALTDDSMTDSSVDGVPPYKLGTKKQLQRDVQRSVRMNGPVSLPHFPRSHRAPRDMGPVEPAAFADQLIARLQRVKREQETMSSLEERLQQIQEEEEQDEADVSGSPPQLSPLSLTLLCEEDPQAILDDHMSRVLKTPGCQSPGVACHSPRSRSPKHRPPTQATACSHAPPGTGHGCGLAPCGQGRAYVARQTKHIHHHYIHHHAGPKSQGQIEAEAAQRVRLLCAGVGDGSPRQRGCSLGREPSGSPPDTALGCSGTLSKRQCCSGEEVCVEDMAPLPPAAACADRSQNVWEWILESDRLNKPQSTPSTRKSHGAKPFQQTHTWVGTHQPAHPFIQDPAMPPLPPPNTLAQLEEACRRLEEVSKPPKQRHSASSLQREKSAPVSPSSCPPLHSEELKGLKKPAGCHGVAAVETVVTYFFCGEEIPYRRRMRTHSLTLGCFKEQLRKKGNYRYYFKKASQEFECGAVFEEVWDDCSILPTYKGKILGKVERID